jgi:hypothetical protein
MRQLEQRIGAKTVLNPLQRSECREYIEQRLRAVNGNTGRIFKSGALRYLIRLGGGVPRRINVLCHNAMLLAYSGGARMVDTRMVEAAVPSVTACSRRCVPRRPAETMRRFADGSGARSKRSRSECWHWQTH